MDERTAPFRAAGIMREGGTVDTAKVKRLVALAYGARDACAFCFGAGRTEVAGELRKDGKGYKKGTSKACVPCDGTGLLLVDAIPRSDKGGVKKSRDTLAESGDDLLLHFAAFGEDAKIRKTYIPFLRGAEVRVSTEDDE
jgi:hypothetical protein